MGSSIMRNFDRSHFNVGFLSGTDKWQEFFGFTLKWLKLTVQAHGRSGVARTESRESEPHSLESS